MYQPTNAPNRIQSIQTIKRWSKGTATPLQALTDPEGSRRLKLPDFKTVGTWRWQGCHPYALPIFTPRKYSWYSFLSQPHSHNVARRIMWMKNSSDTIGNLSHNFLVCSAVPQPLCHFVPPTNNEVHYKYCSMICVLLYLIGCICWLIYWVESDSLFLVW
jgi:hypothetical protein